MLRETIDTEWYWISGELVDYTPEKGVRDDEKNCITLREESYDDRAWDDKDCSTEIPFICKVTGKSYCKSLMYSGSNKIAIIALCQYALL